MDPKMTATDAAEVLGITTQAIKKKIKTKELDCNKSQNRIYFGHETAKTIFNDLIPRPIKHQIITFEIVKGGVGKSTLVSSCAVRASLYGLKVLCVDIDPQGNLTQSFGYNPSNSPVLIDLLNNDAKIEDCIVSVQPGIDLLPSRIENSMLDSTLMLTQAKLPLESAYKNILDPLKKDYDLILIDCPPSLGQSVASAALASDLVVAPVSPEAFCLSGLKITLTELSDLEIGNKRHIPIKILINKFDSRTRLSHEVLKLLFDSPDYREKMFQCYIRTTQDFANVTSQKISIFDAIKPTTAKEDIDIFVKELLNINQLESETEQFSLTTQETELLPL